jgi:hypothetical protein
LVGEGFESAAALRRAGTASPYQKKNSVALPKEKTLSVRRGFCEKVLGSIRTCRRRWPRW